VLVPGPHLLNGTIDLAIDHADDLRGPAHSAIALLTKQVAAAHAVTSASHET
jgi:hypothetical protein